MFDYTNAYSCLSVDDFRKAKDFYGGALGLEITESDDWLVIHFEGGNTLFLYTNVNHKPAAYTVLNFEVEDFEAALKQLEKRGVVVSYTNPGTGMDSASQDDSGQKIGWFEDLSGNIISLTQS